MGKNRIDLILFFYLNPYAHALIYLFVYLTGRVHINNHNCKGGSKAIFHQKSLETCYKGNLQ